MEEMEGLITDMKMLSIVVPTYNEEENILPISSAIVNELVTECPEYDYELIFIDNCSTDHSQKLIRQVCTENPKVKAIFNAKNFGQFNSPYYGMCQTNGDCVMLICADFQDPIDMISVLVHEWEKGYKIVSCIKTSSKENKIMRFLRTCYYRVIKSMSDVEQIEHFTGFGLYDKEFVEILRNLNDPTPFLRGIVAELGFKRKEIAYEQQRRAAGKTHNNWASLYDAAMLSFTSYTKTGLRAATILGAAAGVVSLLIGLVYLILKLSDWDRFLGGTVPTLLMVCILGSMQLFFIGLMGEYILSINKRVMKRPLVIEEERINFGNDNTRG